MIWGLSGGSFSGSGFGALTISSSQRGVPPQVDYVRLVVSNGFDPADLGVTYAAGTGMTHMEFQVSLRNGRTTTCDTFGRGLFMFTRAAMPREGVYEFRCPSAGIDVRGCFTYLP